MQHFEPWHVEQIARTIKPYRECLDKEDYEQLVEDFVDVFIVENPRFGAKTFRKRCGVTEPFNLKAKVPVKRTRKGMGKYG